MYIVVSCTDVVLNAVISEQVLLPKSKVLKFLNKHHLKPATDKRHHSGIFVASAGTAAIYGLYAFMNVCLVACGRM